MLLRNKKIVNPAPPTPNTTTTQQLVENASLIKNIQLVENAEENKQLTQNKNVSMAELDDISVSLEAAKDQITSLAAQINNLQASIDKPKGRVSAFVPVPFYGLSTEDAAEWLDQFKAWLSFEHKDDVTDIANAFQLLLRGTANIWFKNLPAAVKNNAALLFNSFTQHFTSLQPKWILEQQLWNKFMTRNETLDNYISEIDCLATRLKKTESDKCNIFVRGLLPELRVSVIQQKPTSWVECIQAANTAMEAFAISSTPAKPSFSSLYGQQTPMTCEINQIQPSFVMQQQQLPYDISSQPMWLQQSSHGLQSAQYNHMRNQSTLPNVALNPASYVMQSTPSYPTHQSYTSSSSSSRSPMSSQLDDMNQHLREMQSQITALQSNSTSNEFSNNRNSVKVNNMYCQICNKHGHSAYNCFQRYKPRYQNQQTRNTSQNNKHLN